MNTFMDHSVWIGILTIIFGVLLGVFANTVTTWFCFTFLCVVGILRFAVNWPQRK